MFHPSLAWVVPRQKWATVLAVALAVAAALYGAGSVGGVTRQQVLVLVPSRLSPGTTAGLRVVVRDEELRQIENARVQVKLRREGALRLSTVFDGRTGASGTLPISFRVPSAPGKTQLVVDVSSPLGHDRVSRSVLVERRYRLLLTTDKPLYQPGQTIHARALALGSVDRVPASGVSVTLTIADPKGNLVHRQSVTTSDFGVAAWQFPLAEELNAGAYRLAASLADSSSQKTVEVRPYVLPRFRVTIETDRPYYRPGQHAAASVAADYFFGKPVAGGQVNVAGYVQAAGSQQALDMQGATDESGRWAFEFDVPDYFVGGTLEERQSTLALEALVTDGAGHKEQAALDVLVATDDILIDAIPESGTLKGGVENVIYIVTTYPDGRPATCDVAIDGQELATGPSGVAEYRMRPQGAQDLQVRAQDAAGRQAQRSIGLDVRWAAETVLLRTDRAAYRVGETILVTSLAVPPGGVFLDIEKGGQVLSSLTIDGRTSIDVDPAMVGTLDLHAYRVIRDGTIVRDTRRIVVAGADEIAVAVTADAETYRPGGTARLRFQTTARGKPVPTVIGVAAVDESVFALQSQDASLAKLYFLLEDDLLKPRYQIKGVSWRESVVEPVVAAGERSAVAAGERSAIDDAARIDLAGAPTSFDPSLADSQADRIRAAEAARARVLGAAAKLAAVLVTLLPVVVAAGAAFSMHRRGVLSFAVAVAAIVALTMLVVGYGVVRPSVLESFRRAAWIDMRGDGGGPLRWMLETAPLSLAGLYRVGADLAAGVAICVLVGGLLAPIALAVRARGDRDKGLATMSVALAAYVGSLGALALIAWGGQDLRNLGVNPIAMWSGVTASLLLPTALGIAGIGLLSTRRVLSGGLALIAAYGLLVVQGTLTDPYPVYAWIASVRDSESQADVSRSSASYQAAEWGAARSPYDPRAYLADRDEGGGQSGKNSADTRKPEAGGAPSDAAQTAPPRLRRLFPETLYVNPEVLTNDQGTAELDIPLADSITTWRLSALASSRVGELGSADVGLRVFQDFFIDLDLPVALTVGDEVSVPVAVYNYLDERQTVRLEVTPEDWFELLAPPSQSLSIGANDVAAAYVPIRVREHGSHKLTVTATGDRLSDAIEKPITVHPDGRKVQEAQGDWLDGTVATTVTIPADVVPGSGHVWIKILPGVVSQVVDGLDGMLEAPYGCFEQTTSITYPNVLVLDYLKRSGKASPAVQMEAERYISLGYQRLLTFEVATGGFSYYGDAPAYLYLSAKGVLELNDMSRVRTVDRALIDRTARWLIEQESERGTWVTTDYGWSETGGAAETATTAYVAWALAEAGYGADSSVARALDWLEGAAATEPDPYSLALVANALVSAGGRDEAASVAIDRLAGVAVRSGNRAYWSARTSTLFGAYDDAGRLETTALAAHAFLRAGRQAELAQAALNYLVAERDPLGAWGSTQATILALKALVAAAGRTSGDARGTIRASLDGVPAEGVDITADNADAVHLVSFPGAAAAGDHALEIVFEGRGSLAYQVVSEYYVPWAVADGRDSSASDDEPLVVSVQYDRTQLRVSDMVTSHVRVSMANPAVIAETVLVDLGVPPGFSVMTEDLEQLVEHGTIARYEVTGRQVIVYLERFPGGSALDFAYRMAVRLPMRAKSPPSQVYDYYNPTVRSELPPVAFVVREVDVSAARPPAVPASPPARAPEEPTS